MNNQEALNKILKTVEEQHKPNNYALSLYYKHTLNKQQIKPKQLDKIDGLIPLETMEYIEKMMKYHNYTDTQIQRAYEHIENHIQLIGDI